LFPSKPNHYKEQVGVHNYFYNFAEKERKARKNIDNIKKIRNFALGNQRRAPIFD